MPELTISLRGRDGQVRTSRTELPDAVVDALSRAGTLKIRCADGWAMTVELETPNTAIALDRRREARHLTADRFQAQDTRT